MDPIHFVFWFVCAFVFDLLESQRELETQKPRHRDSGTKGNSYALIQSSNSYVLGFVGDKIGG